MSLHQGYCSRISGQSSRQAKPKNRRAACSGGGGFGSVGVTRLLQLINAC